jgi:glucose/arabinose dehydrogenase
MPRVSGFVLACILTASCGSGPTSPTTDGPVERIMGNERLGWDQRADTAQAVASLRFVAYVDNVRSDMREVECGTTPGAAGFACSGKLPVMTSGRHALQLASVSDENVESDRSEALQVIVATATSAFTMPQTRRAGGGSAARGLTTADGVDLRLETVADGLSDPTDLVVLPDGAILVAERAGSLRLLRPDGPYDPASPAALTLTDVDATGHGGLLGLAPDPQFDRNGFVYVVYTSTAGFRLARFRASGDEFGDRAVLIDRIAPTSDRPAAALRFGPDAKLYLGIDDGGDARRAGDLGSFSGKVLRLNPDGTTPPDQAGGTPIYVVDINAPAGFAWSSAAGPLWIAQTRANGAGGELRGVLSAQDRTAQRGRIAMRYVLPDGTRPSPMVIYGGRLLPAFQGNLLLAGGENGGVLRVRFDASDPLKVVSAERLFDSTGPPIRAVAAAPDGSIYVATPSTVMRIVP